MKKKIISMVVFVIVMVVCLRFCQRGNDRPIIMIDGLEIKLLTSTYGDLTDYGYTEVDKRDWIHLFTRSIGPKLYIGTTSYGNVSFQHGNDSLIDYIGLDVEDAVSIKIDDLHLSIMSKEELAEKFDLVEFNGIVRFIYEDYYFICLSYTDDKLDGFAAMYNTDGKLSIRDADLDYRKYEDQWIIK